ncbi:ribonuclease T2 [Seohaeicola saemankumensis]|nr:ribonuclease T2 [Seohaeicola saemankumensis]MCA0871708.1 ribonuclease T2 [Seohaeicola saemankumensis]
MRVLLLWLLLALPALADGEKAGEFDYYVLALSWSPNWCATTGDARNADQCHPRHDYGWILHGLWPQYHRGWPAYCRTPHAPPSRGQTAAMTDIMASPGLAWHQWKKHGTCSGLTAAQYFALSRRAYDAVTRPDLLRRLDKPVQLPASLIEDAFLQANPGWDRNMLTITCADGHIAETRLCLSRDLQPVPCGRDVIADCKLKDALFNPVR